MGGEGVGEGADEYCGEGRMLVGLHWSIGLTWMCGLGALSRREIVIESD